MMRPFSAGRLARFGAMAVVAFGVMACGGGSDGPTAPTPVSVQGTWNLQTVNGSSLPYLVLGSGNNKIELTGEILTVSSGGSFTDTEQYRITENGVARNQSDAYAGTYVLNGSAVTFTYNGGDSGTGTISGNTLTVANDGFSFVFRKQ